MAQSDYTKTLNKLQNLVNKELLKKGFYRKGRTHNKVFENGIVHVIDFQSGEFPVNDKYVIPGVRESFYGKFAVNLGVFIPEVYEETNGLFSKTIVPEYICQVRIRLAALSMGKDNWWTVGDNYPEVADDLIKMLNNEAEQWFSNFTTKAKIIESLQDASIPNLYSRTGKLNAALLQLKTDRYTGERLLKEYYQLCSDHNGHQAYVAELAYKVGVELE